MLSVVGVPFERDLASDAIFGLRILIEDIYQSRSMDDSREPS
jgi:hypothetical protein